MSETEQSVLNKWGVPHQVHQDIVHEAEAAWFAVIDQHIGDFSPVDKRIFLEYAMLGVVNGCCSRMIITGVLAKQAAREHIEGIVNRLDEKYGSPEGLKQAIEDEYGGDDRP